MTARPTLVVFLGGAGGGSAERMVGEARIAASLDCTQAALASAAAFEGAVLVTDDSSLVPEFPGVTIDLDAGRFHFGRRLAGVLREHGIQSAVYMGGGSVPLFGPEDFASLAGTVAVGHAVTNNTYSSDLVAFPVTEDALRAIESVERDNALARALLESGIQMEEMSRTYVTQLDIDSPADLAVLSITSLGGKRLRGCLEGLDLDTGAYRRVLPLFLDTSAQIVVAGRVGSRAWQYMERETACRVRLFAEERGMEAEGRGAGTARSLLGFYLDEVGPQRFFETLAALGDAAFLDTRVLLAHEGIEATREDRFLSDLRCWRDIREPFLRELTRAAVDAPVPVLLGGHSLMSGGLMGLNEFAWRQREAGVI